MKTLAPMPFAGASQSAMRDTENEGRGYEGSLTNDYRLGCLKDSNGKRAPGLDGGCFRGRPFYTVLRNLRITGERGLFLPGVWRCGVGRWKSVSGGFGCCLMFRAISAKVAQSPRDVE
jgi:hypothetical protein